MCENADKTHQIFRQVTIYSGLFKGLSMYLYITN